MAGEGKARPDDTGGRSFRGPSRYVQRAGEITRIADHVRTLGDNLFVLVDGSLHDTIGRTIGQSLEKAGTRFIMERFGGECCTEEIDRVTALARAAGANCVVGVGGGKTADTAKVAAITIGARIVIVPTIASTDAPTSAIAVRYSKHGVHEEAMFLSRNPDAVIVDSAVIVKAPVRFLVAGIGDALSTWYEARSNLESHTPNLASPPLAAPAAGIAIARKCHDVLMRDAVAATRAAEKGLLTPAVESIIEANTLLSGLGFENCGVSAAHGIHDGLTVLDEVHGFYHGEKVAFGVLCLLVLEGRPSSEIEETIRFCRAVGLPTRLADLNLGKATPDDIQRVAEASLKPGSATFNAAAPVSPAIVRDAILGADALSTALDS